MFMSTIIAMKTVLKILQNLFCVQDIELYLEFLSENKSLTVSSIYVYVYFDAKNEEDQIVLYRR